MSTVRNTTHVERGDAIEAMALRAPVFVELQESRGQQELVQSTVLPREFSEPREVYASLGFKLGANVEGDPLFIHAELPAG